MSQVEQIEMAKPKPFTSTRTAAAHRRADLFDIYLWALCIVLAGYALMDKGFAYIGVRGFYVAEVVVLLGLIAFAWRRHGGNWPEASRYGCSWR